MFILADDLGYGDLGCYGQARIKTPNIDRLATRGKRFTQCYAGSTVCAPSRCSLMTGLHTGHARVRGNALVPLRPEDVTVAEVLKRAGYATGIVGKWGLGEPGTTGVPNRQGFDEWFGYLNQHHAHNYYPEYLWKNEQKYRLEGNEEKGQSNYAVKAVQYAPDLFTREALDFLDRHRAKPFFLFLTYTLPHANNERGRAEGNGMEVPSDAPYSAETWPQVEKNHAAMITRLDGDVGRVLERLKDLGLEDDTIVFFSSDNGPHKEGGADPGVLPQLGAAPRLQAGAVRRRHPRADDRPVAGQGRGRVGQRRRLGLLGCAAHLRRARRRPAPSGLDGVSQVPAIVGKGQPAPREFLYWEFHEGGFKQAVRTGDWKAVRLGPGRPLELYDIKNDIGEAHDVAAEHPEVVARIEGYLRSARIDSPAFPVRPLTR